MKLLFTKRDKLILAVGVLLLILLIVYAQFVSLSPLKTELTGKQQTLQNEQNLLDAASQKKNVNLTKTADDTRELQKRLPVKPLEDQFILDLEKAENVSNSQIKTMGFSKDVDVATASTDPNGQNANGQQQTTNGQQPNTPAAQTSTDQTAANQGSTQTATPQQPAALPASGVKKLTVNMSVESPNYEAFEKFIQTLEALKRIVVVESISYAGTQEVTALTTTTPDTNKLTFSITVSTFYMPVLADLQAELPKIDVPAPAGKVNPLSQFSTTTNPN